MNLKKIGLVIVVLFVVCVVGLLCSVPNNLPSRPDATITLTDAGVGPDGSAPAVVTLDAATGG